jgi:hypothetical protein
MDTFDKGEPARVKRWSKLCQTPRSLMIIRLSVIPGLELEALGSGLASLALETLSNMSALDHLPRLVLSELLLNSQQHLSLDELARALSMSVTEVEDAAAQLARDGLVHRHAEFVFPTRAAVECDRLLTL